MAYDKVINSAKLDADLTAVADAIRTKGGTYAPLSFPSGFIGAVQGLQVGGGNVEQGEITTTSANSYGFTIPVSSRKTHLLVYLKSITNQIANAPGQNGSRVLFAADGDGRIEVAPSKNASTTHTFNGASYWYDSAHATNKVTFNNTSIVVTQFYSPWGTGSYDWIAW